jgi:PilZ domain
VAIVAGVFRSGIVTKCSLSVAVLLTKIRLERYFRGMRTSRATRKTREERRRSKRLPLSIPVRVYGRTPDNRPFRDITTTKAVSAHGGLLPIAPKVKRGQTVLLVNGITEEERECKVVFVEGKQRGPRTVGLQFTNLKGDFWHVFTPLVGAR